MLTREDFLILASIRERLLISQRKISIPFCIHQQFQVMRNLLGVWLEVKLLVCLIVASFLGGRTLSNICLGLSHKLIESAEAAQAIPTGN